MEHLYPAREGMLRRGTSVAKRVTTGTLYGEVRTVRPDGSVVVAMHDHIAICTGLLLLVLRDVTARAHAAMPYTAVDISEGVPDIVWSDRLHAVVEERYSDWAPWEMQAGRPRSVTGLLAAWANT